MDTVHAHFIRALERYPEKPLFREQRGTLSYGETAVRVGAAVERFRRLGLKRGDIVACFTDQTIPQAMFVLTAGLMRVIPATISPVFSRQYLKTLCKMSGARAIYTTAEHVKVAEGLGIPVIVYGGELGAKEQLDPRAVPRERVLFDDATRIELRDAHAAIRDLSSTLCVEDALLIQPTSGSSGVPKLVLRNHVAFSRYAMFVGRELERGLGSARRFRMLAANALTHAFACHMFATALRFGAELAIPSELDISASLEEVRALDPEVLPMTPRILRSLIRQQQASEAGAGRLFGPSAKLYLTAGGKSDADALHRLRAEGVEIIEFYGSSEASLVTVTPYGGWSPGSAGVPVPDVSLKFNRSGEVLVKSPGLMLGYHGDTELTDVMIDEDGYFRTGDLGRLDEHGYVQIFGRRRDIFNTPEGSNIYPERVEIQLESLAWVEQAFLVGDGRPYVTAHLVVRPELRHAKAIPRTAAVELLRECDIPERSSNAISVEGNEDLYDYAGGELARLNQVFEVIEQVVAFVLYDSSLSPDVYKTVTAGKVHRDRPRFLELYKNNLESLYDDLANDSLMRVPPGERRCRFRTAPIIATDQPKPGKIAL